MAITFPESSAAICRNDSCRGWRRERVVGSWGRRRWESGLRPSTSCLIVCRFIPPFLQTFLHHYDPSTFAVLRVPLENDDGLFGFFFVILPHSHGPWLPGSTRTTTMTEDREIADFIVVWKFIHLREGPTREPLRSVPPEKSWMGQNGATVPSVPMAILHS